MLEARDVFGCAEPRAVHLVGDRCDMNGVPVMRLPPTPPYRSNACLILILHQ